MRPRSTRTFLGAALFCPCLLLAAPLPLSAQDEGPPAGETKEEKEAPERPTLEKYLESMSGFLPREHAAAGFSITSTVIPDLKMYGLARALEKAKKNGWSEEKTEAHLREEHKKLVRVKEDRILVRVEIHPSSQSNHLFLQKKVKSHVDVDGEAKVASVTNGEPEPRFDKWTIIQGASMKSFTLARFVKLVFEVEVRKRTTDVCHLELVDLYRYEELPRKSEYETKGINVEARQISLGTIRDMLVDPIRIELAPATWEEPLLPEELETWRQKIEKE